MVFELWKHDKKPKTSHLLRTKTGDEVKPNLHRIAPGKTYLIEETTTHILEVKRVS